MTNPQKTLPHKSPKQQKSWLVTALVILLTTSWLVSGCLVYQNYKLRKKLTTKTAVIPEPAYNPPQSTNSWKTYNDEVHGFKFKYPEEIEFSKQDDGSIHLKLLGPTQKDIPEFYDGIWLTFSLPFELEKVSLKQHAEASLLQIREEGFEEVTRPLEELSIGKLNGYTYTSGGIGNIYSRYIFLQSPESMVAIRIVDSTQDLSNQGYMETVNQIIYTFQFIK